MFPLVDAHVHFWNPQRLTYDWLRNSPAIAGVHEPPQYRAASHAQIAEHLIFVECGCAPAQARDEVLYASAFAEVSAVVAAAPLEKGKDVRHELEWLVNQPKVRGVRRLLPNGNGALQSNFVEGVQALQEFDLSFDICIGHAQLGDAIALVRRCPQVRFVLDHMAKPDIKNALFEPWRQQLNELATLPNVWCKISGIVTEADVEHWTTEDLRPYIEYAIACFGWQRVMCGGDWPVVNLAGGRARWIAALEEVVNGCSPAEQRHLFYDNARAFYRI
jgi:L-fuconolactonase